VKHLLCCVTHQHILCRASRTRLIELVGATKFQWNYLASNVAAVNQKCIAVQSNDSNQNVIRPAVSSLEVLEVNFQLRHSRPAVQLQPW
jgi:hypothetical protein